MEYVYKTETIGFIFGVIFSLQLFIWLFNYLKNGVCPRILVYFEGMILERAKKLGEEPSELRDFYSDMLFPLALFLNTLLWHFIARSLI